MTESYRYILFPQGLGQHADGSALYGYNHPDTGQMVIVGAGDQCAQQPAGELLGWLEPPVQQAATDNAGLVARRVGGELQFSIDGQPCPGEAYSLEADLFSRHTGVLESSLLQGCGVIICGCGSVGSLAALDLARSGVGRFLLIDPDLLAIENLCRHQCGLADVGRKKVAAVADRIHQINPSAQVEFHALPLEHLDPAVVAGFAEGHTLMLACADSRRADRHAARLAAAIGCPFLAIGLWERAFAGEIFYSHSGMPMPCYGCAFDGLAETITARPEPARRFYSTETDLEKLNYQPGIAIDISFVTQIALKLAIDLLNLHNPDHVPRLLGHLSQFTLVCNSNDSRLGGERAEIFSHPLQVTSSIAVSFGPQCPPCRWSE